MFLKLLCFKEQRIHGAQEIFVSILHRTAKYIYAHYMKKRKKLGFWLQSPLRGSDLFGTMQKCTVLRLPSFRGPRTWTLLVKSQVAWEISLLESQATWGYGGGGGDTEIVGHALPPSPPPHRTYVLQYGPQLLHRRLCGAAGWPRRPDKRRQLKKGGRVQSRYRDDLLSVKI